MRYEFESQGNPIVRHIHTADPAALVKGDTLWLFAGRDQNGNQSGYVMKDWLVFSTTDMKHWTQYPVPLKVEDFKWLPVNRRTPDMWLNATANTIGMSVPTGVVSAWPYPTNHRPLQRCFRQAVAHQQDCFDSHHSWACIDPAVFIDATARLTSRGVTANATS